LYKIRTQQCGTLVEHGPLDDSVKLVVLTKLVVDESNLKVVFFMNDGKEREENDRASIRQ